MLTHCKKADCYCENNAWYRIAAHNNAIGSRIVNYVPDLLPAPTRKSGVFEYCAPNDDRDPTGYAVRAAIAQLEQVKSEDVRITASVLDFLGMLPALMNRRSIVKLATDFKGYGRGANRESELIDIPLDVRSAIDPAMVAEFVRKARRPIVFLTFPVTNPGQQHTSLSLVEQVLHANADAIVVLDNAYRGSSEDRLARYVLSNPRTLYVNTASKDLYLCGARFGWVIAAPLILDRISSALPPYGVGKEALTIGLHVLSRPNALRAARVTQAVARDIIDHGLRRLGLDVHCGPGPWTLVHLGDDAVRVVRVLAEAFLIDVQLQLGSMAGWIRVSATVPCEAGRIVAAFSRILGTASGSSADHDLCCESDLQPLVANPRNEQPALTTSHHVST